MILRPQIVILFLALAMLSGCSSLAFVKNDAVTTELANSTAKTSAIPAPDTQAEDKPISVKHSDITHGHSAATLDPGTGKLINADAAARPVSSSTPAAAATGDEVALNFENQPIQAVVQAILGAWLNENYTIAPAVTGNVTFSTSKPISSAQALPVLEMLLTWTNNALIRKQGHYEVVPIKDAVAGNLSPNVSGARYVPGYQVRVFPLRYISATEMQKLLKPYARADAIIAADNARSMLVMAGTSAELQNYEHTIDIFDVDWLKGMSVGVFGLRNVDVTKIMPELDKLFGPTADSPLAGLFRFIPMETTNSVLVITSQPEYLKRAEEWLYRLDIGAGENGTQLYVYNVKNVKSVDLSDHLNAIFTGKSSGTTKSNSGNTAPGLKATNIGSSTGRTTGLNSTSTSTSSSLLQTRQSTSNTATGTNNLTTTGTGAPTTGAVGEKETDIRITPVEENNQLLIMATPGEYDTILAAIRRLDVSPLQVQIETKILEVTLSGELSYGVQWYLGGLINANGTNDTGYTYGRTPTYTENFTGNSADRHRASLGATTGATPTTNGGLFYSIITNKFQAVLSALETSTNTKVLSAPSMVVLNNQEAQIVVGTQIPISTTTISGLTTASTTATESSVSYVSTGVTLDVKPRVNPGGLVYMEVQQEVSSAGAASCSGCNPPINQRTFQTQVAVQSGETVLLGGLISEDDSTTKNGLPFLNGVPVLGSLFGNSDRNRQRTELIVLITPQVITNSDDARALTKEYQNKFESLAPLRAKQAQANDSGVTITPLSPAPAASPRPNQ